MKVTFDQHIGIFEDAVSKEWCNKLINVFNQNENYTNSRQEDFNYSAKTNKEDLAIDLTYFDKDLCHKFSKNFWKYIYPIYQSEYKLENIIQYPLKIQDFKIQKTNPTEGYHLWHAESPHRKVSDRVMVYTLYLNDVEEGGETEFLIQSKRIKPKQGTICIFPASYTHIHRGNPPLSGTKYIMTGWIVYPENNQDE